MLLAASRSSASSALSAAVSGRSASAVTEPPHVSGESAWATLDRTGGSSERAFGHPLSGPGQGSTNVRRKKKQTGQPGPRVLTSEIKPGPPSQCMVHVVNQPPLGCWIRNPTQQGGLPLELVHLLVIFRSPTHCLLRSSVLHRPPSSTCH